MRILLAEDDTLLGDGLRAGLQQEGYVVDWVVNGEEADAALRTESFDVALLDWNMPGRSGLAILKGLRERHNPLPVLILTARDAVEDRVTGLDTGADDYLVKPFDLEELHARIRSLLRRSSGRSTPLLSASGITIDPASRTVLYKGEAKILSPREYALLHLLMENAGKVLSKSRLEESLYGWNNEVESNTVEVYIHHLRRKFDADCIRTVRGVGYLMNKD